MAVYLPVRGRDRCYNLGGDPQEFFTASIYYLGFRGRSRSFDISKESPTPVGGEKTCIVTGKQIGRAHV